MNRKERFYATIERKPVDYPASWLGLPVAEALPALFKQFGVKTYNELKEKIGDDIYAVEVPFNKPPLNHIACAFDFAQKGTSSNEERTLTAPGFFEDFTDPSRVEEFNWPNPEEHMDFEIHAEGLQILCDICDKKSGMLRWDENYVGYRGRCSLCENDWPES